MALARTLVDLNTPYLFRLVSSATLSTNGSGVVAGYQNADPSGGSGSTWTATEWSALTSLFSEVKMREFRLTFVFDTYAALVSYPAICISGVKSYINSAPTSIVQVWDNADAVIWNSRDTSKNGITHGIKGTDLNYAVVTTPNPGSYAGCPGAIQWYGSGAGTSQSIGLIMIEGIYEFRSRI